MYTVAALVVVGWCVRARSRGSSGGVMVWAYMVCVAVVVGWLCMNVVGIVMVWVGGSGCVVEVMWCNDIEVVVVCVCITGSIDGSCGWVVVVVGAW